jgi:hypothetical protein
VRGRETYWQILVPYEAYLGIFIPYIYHVQSEILVLESHIRIVALLDLSPSICIVLPIFRFYNYILVISVILVALKLASSPDHLSLQDIGKKCFQ